MPKVVKKAKAKKALKQKQKQRQNQRQVVNVNIQQALRNAIRRRQPANKSSGSVTQIFRTNEPSAPFYQPFMSAAQPVPIPAPVPVPVRNFIGQPIPPVALPLMQRAGDNVNAGVSRNIQSYFQPQPRANLFSSSSGAGVGAGAVEPSSMSEVTGRSAADNYKYVRSPYESDVRQGYKTDFGTESEAEPPMFIPQSQPQFIGLPRLPSGEAPRSRRRGGENWYWDGEEKALKQGVPIPEGKYWNRLQGKFKKIPKV